MNKLFMPLPTIRPLRALKKKRLELLKRNPERKYVSGEIRRALTVSERLIQLLGSSKHYEPTTQTLHTHQKQASETARVKQAKLKAQRQKISSGRK